MVGGGGKQEAKKKHSLAPSQQAKVPCRSMRVDGSRPWVMARGPGASLGTCWGGAGERLGVARTAAWSPASEGITRASLVSGRQATSSGGYVSLTHARAVFACCIP